MRFSVHPTFRPTTLTVTYDSLEYNEIDKTVKKITFQKEYPFKTKEEKSNLVKVLRLKVYRAFQKFNTRRLAEIKARDQKRLADISAELYNIIHSSSLRKPKEHTTTNNQDEFDIRSSTVMGQCQEDYRKQAPSRMAPGQTTLETILE